jgi:hypothetical protein
MRAALGHRKLPQPPYGLLPNGGSRAETKPGRMPGFVSFANYGLGTPGKSASPIVGMNCGGTRMCVACSKSYA